MRIYYKNSAGKEVCFSDAPVMVDITGLMGFAYTYGSSAYARRFGGRVSGFSAGVVEKSMTVGISASTEDTAAFFNQLLSCVHYDIEREMPGRLYVGDEYLLCNIHGSSVDLVYDPEVEYTERTYQVVLSYPFWCTDVSMDFLPGGRVVEAETYLDYSYDYSYDYLFDDFAIGELMNDHYAASDFLMMIFGPCINPRILIAGHTYAITAEIFDGEYVLVDSRTGTITRVTAAGEQSNLFNFRDKDNNIFEKIPAGNSDVVFDRSFGFSITLFQERSEPKWSI